MVDLQKFISLQILPKGKMESKVEEFINLVQGGMSVKGYFLKFIKLSIYASSSVLNDRDAMNHFVIGLTKEFKEECRAYVFHENMELSRLMVHA